MRIAFSYQIPILRIEPRRKRAQIFLVETEVLRFDEVGKIRNSGDSTFLGRKLFQNNEELERCAQAGNVIGLNPPFKVARQRFFSHDARNRFGVGSTLTNYQCYVSQAVPFAQDQPLDLLRNTSNLSVAITAFEIPDFSLFGIRL